jgi:hypothetical protein
MEQTTPKRSESVGRASTKAGDLELGAHEKDGQQTSIPAAEEATASSHEEVKIVDSEGIPVCITWLYIILVNLLTYDYWTRQDGGYGWVVSLCMFFSNGMFVFWDNALVRIVGTDEKLYSCHIWYSADSWALWALERSDAVFL